MARSERTTISDFKVGDIYLRENTYEYLITKIEPFGGHYVRWECEWTGKGYNPGKRQTTYEWSLTGILWRMIQRKCAPCYDSDCDCIYDGVG